MYVPKLILFSKCVKTYSLLKNATDATASIERFAVVKPKKLT